MFLERATQIDTTGRWECCRVNFVYIQTQGTGGVPRMRRHTAIDDRLPTKLELFGLSLVLRPMITFAYHHSRGEHEGTADICSQAPVKRK